MKSCLSEYFSDTKKKLGKKSVESINGIKPLKLTETKIQFEDFGTHPLVLVIKFPILNSFKRYNQYYAKYTFLERIF